VNEKFWQLKVYAVLIRAMNRKRDKDEETVVVADGVALRKLKLMFLTSESGGAQVKRTQVGAHAGEKKERQLREKRRPQRPATLCLSNTCLSNTVVEFRVRLGRE